MGRLNALRAWAGLRAVSSDPELSEGCWLHARYMAENGWIGHSEDPANRFYTPPGAAAAGKSICSLGIDGAAAIDAWATGPFHAVEMLDPDLGTVGFGTYRTSFRAARRGAQRLAQSACLGRLDRAFVPGGVAGSGGPPVDLGAYRGGEFPDPLAGIGYSTPSGLPIASSSSGRAASHRGSTRRICAATGERSHTPPTERRVTATRTTRTSSLAARFWAHATRWCWCRATRSLPAGTTPS